MNQMAISHEESLATLESNLIEQHRAEIEAIERQLKNEMAEVNDTLISHSPDSKTVILSITYGFQISGFNPTKLFFHFPIFANCYTFNKCIDFIMPYLNRKNVKRVW